MQEWLTPHRAALKDACWEKRLDFNAADTLSMLNPQATVDQIVACLAQFSDSLEAVRRLLNIDSIVTSADVSMRHGVLASLNYVLG
jgi:hypothetical protein